MLLWGWRCIILNSLWLRFQISTEHKLSGNNNVRKASRQKNLFQPSILPQCRTSKVSPKDYIILFGDRLLYEKKINNPTEFRKATGDMDLMCLNKKKLKLEYTQKEIFFSITGRKTVYWQHLNGISTALGLAKHSSELVNFTLKIKKHPEVVVYHIQ